MKIYGAGFSGLLAGTVFQTAKIYEARPEQSETHKAVLRFRTSAVGDAVGVDFRKVVVHKGVWSEGHYVRPNVRLANLYAKKVIGRLTDRSVWNVDTCERFIAPPDFIQQLTERCAKRIVWGHAVTKEEILANAAPSISTLPMKVMAEFFEVADAPDFVDQAIVVKRWKIHGSDVFQSVYFPDSSTSLYRASITGDTLIAEYVPSINAQDRLETLCAAFGLNERDIEPVETTRQRYGKIGSIDDAWRKRFIFWLTQEHGVMSLGRYGTWRNILLDDVVKDVAVIKKIMNTSGYDRMKINAK